MSILIFKRGADKITIGVENWYNFKKAGDINKASACR
jgi:hypothetical protein